MTDKKRFQGIVVPLVNPCDADDGLDWTLLKENLARLLATDVRGLYINGGTGDAANLSQEERLETAAFIVPRLKAAGKLSIVHVGQTSQRQALELARQAVELGADAVASIPPRKAWPQIVDYYKALAETGARLIVYYIPAVTGMTAGMAELSLLLDIPAVVGIKMSDWNSFLLRNLSLDYPDRVIYSGFDELLLPGLLYGADGSIGTWANLLPELYAKLYVCVRAGRLADAKALMDEFTAFLALGWRWGILDSFEALMRAKGYAQRCFRRPSSWEPDKLEAAALEELLSRLGRLEEQAAAL